MSPQREYSVEHEALSRKASNGRKDDSSQKKLNQIIQYRTCPYTNRNSYMWAESIFNTRKLKALADFQKSNVLMAFIISPLFVNQPSRILAYQQISRFSTCQLSQKKVFYMSGSKGISKIENCPEAVYRRKVRVHKCPVMPKCLKYVRPPKDGMKIDYTKMSCGRICMPCCPKARYPPICIFPTVRRPCCRVPNPRPSFSECAKDYYKDEPLCMCCTIKPPPCRLLPNIDDSCSYK